MPPSVTILPPRLVAYELERGATRVTHNFEAMGRPEATYRFTWKFGDGNTFAEIVQPGVSSRVSHTYYNLNAGDRFYPEVTLETVDRVFLAVDSMTINITQASDSGQGSTTSGTFRPSDDLPWISYTITGAGDTSYVDSPESDNWWEANQDVRVWSQTEERYEKRFMPGSLESFSVFVPVAQGQRVRFYINVIAEINKGTRMMDPLIELFRQGARHVGQAGRLAWPAAGIMGEHRPEFQLVYGGEQMRFLRKHIL